MRKIHELSMTGHPYESALAIEKVAITKQGSGKGKIHVVPHSYENNILKEVSITVTEEGSSIPVKMVYTINWEEVKKLTKKKYH